MGIVGNKEYLSGLMGFLELDVAQVVGDGE